jgi:leader peptidase (prepilin peptidase)/N-methyltransferase
MDKLIIFIFGAIIGSFLNVCIHRMPKGESVVRPASRCPRCKEPIRFYDNIPIVSYLALKGRCRACGYRIPLRYPVVELLTAVLFLSLYLVFGVNDRSVTYAAFISALIVATFVDLQTQEIPDEISLGGLAAGLALSFVFPCLQGQSSGVSGIIQSGLGALAGGGSIYLMGLFGGIVFKKEAMGGGDVKLMAMVGSFLGWKLALLVFFMAPIFGSVVGIALKLKDGRDTIPYGPYLSLAAVVAIFFGEKIIKSLFIGL